jgi:hypothetical protein
MCVPHATNRILVGKAELSASPHSVSEWTHSILGCALLAIQNDGALQSPDGISKESGSSHCELGQSGPLVDPMEHLGAVGDHHDPEHDEHCCRQRTPVSASGRRRHSSSLFPAKLHAALHELEQEGLRYIASWAPHGRGLMVHKKQMFVDNVLPR